MTMISDIPHDLVEEIISRVPKISPRTLRSTCKQWNALSKDPRFTKKRLGKAGKEILLIMTYDSRVCLMRVNFDGTHPFIKQIGKLYEIKICKVFHCHGLLLCLTKEEVNDRLVVWNPYLGQTRRIEPSKNFHRFDRYAFGYDNNNNKNHKILRVLYGYEGGVHVEYEIYDFNSNSWRIVDVTPDLYISSYGRNGVSLKGNAYFVAQERLDGDEVDFLICFDFTRERFGPRLHLPFHSRIRDYVILSNVREEQLAVLFQRHDTYETEIWITTKVEPDAVLWTKLFKVDRKLFTKRCNGTFVVDEKKKIAVIYGEKWNKNKAYMIGENGYYREEDLGESKCLSLVCSYIPSSVQIQQAIHATAGGKRKERDYY